MFGAVHEGPQSLRANNNVVFRKGMTITNEPGVYEDGKFGIRTENLMLVDDACENEYGHFLKFEIVTVFPIDTSPVLPELLTNEELDVAERLQQPRLRNAFAARFRSGTRLAQAPHTAGRSIKFKQNIKCTRASVTCGCILYFERK